MQCSLILVIASSKCNTFSHMRLYFYAFLDFKISGGCLRFDKANKKSFSTSYFPWLMSGYGLGECSCDIFIPICLQNLDANFFFSHVYQVHN